MASHPLDRPVWHALTSHQAAMAEGDGRALRFRPELSPFAAAADTGAASLAALAALIPADRETWLIEADPIVPPGAVVVGRAPLVQMVAPCLVADAPREGIVALEDADAPAIRALAALTRPGPFREATHRLGAFLGVKVDGTLVAMAGERLHLAGHAEVSGVCTHPDYRGRGLAGLLMRAVMDRIARREERPFLTAYASNAGAIALYRTLGFTVRATVESVILARG